MESYVNKPRGNPEWTIQRQWKHWEHKSLDKDKQNTNIQHRNLKQGVTRSHQH